MVRVLMTRPEPGATQTARRLEAAGFTALLLPLTRIEALPVPDLAIDVGCVAVTSANAIRHAPPELLRRLAAKPCFAVGAATAAAARNAGFVTVIEGPGQAPAMAAEIVASAGKGTVAYLCGRGRLPLFEEVLAQADIPVRPMETYDTLTQSYAPEALRKAFGDAPVEAALVYSLRAAQALANLRDTPEAGSFLTPTRFFCLSQRIAVGLGTVRPDRLFWSGMSEEAALLTQLRQTFFGAASR